MVKNTKLLAGVASVGMSLLGALVLVAPSAGASADSVASAPVKGLLTTAQAKKLGFSKVADKPVTSTKTGVSGCSKGAQAAYEDGHGVTGIISEVLVCKSASGPTALIKKEKGLEKASANLKPPKQLGSAAIERAAQGSTYAIYWQRGKILELLAFDSDIAASSSSSTTTTAGPVAAITAKQQQTLTKAALEQDAAAH
jgi:hypothetical protein